VIRFFDLLSSGFFQRALVEVVVVGALAGAVGAHVVLRRQSFFATALSHATFPGVVLADIIGISVLAGALGFGGLVVLAVFALGAERALDTSAATGAVLAGSLGLGVVLQSGRTGASKDLASLLVGSVLTVDRADVIATIVVAVVVLGLVVALHKELVLGAFDPEQARALGYSRGLDLVLLLMIQAIVATCVPAVGTVLAVALLIVPALTARLWCERMGSTMVLGAALGALSGVLGLAASAQWRVSAGASVALAATALFAVSLVLVGLRERVGRGTGAGADRSGGVSSRWALTGRAPGATPAR
jgi:manganese/iron transport system permease protein